MSLSQCGRRSMARRFDFGSMRDALRAMPKSGMRSASVIGSNVAGIGTLQRFGGAEESRVVKGSLYGAFATTIQCMEQNRFDVAAKRG
jgi:hypothetical protein